MIISTIPKDLSDDEKREHVFSLLKAAGFDPEDEDSEMANNCSKFIEELGIDSVSFCDKNE